MFFQKYFRWIVIALPALFYFGSVWQRPLYLETEFRQAEIARETATTFPVPSLNGEQLPGTPPLVHWCNAAVMKGIGEQPAAVRLTAALATLLTAGVIWLLGKRSGIPRLGEAAALIWLFCGAVYTAGTRGGDDALFVLFNTVTLAAFFLAATETVPRRRIGFLVLCGIGWAAAILCRGGEALLTAAVPAVVLLLRRREEGRALLSLLWIPLLVAALLVAGCAAACRAAPAAWLLPGGDSAPGSPVAGLLLSLAGLLPWILFLPMVWHGYRIAPEGARRSSSPSECSRRPTGGTTGG